jgi:hypothetical protein
MAIIHIVDMKIYLCRVVSMFKVSSGFKIRSNKTSSDYEGIEWSSDLLHRVNSSLANRAAHITARTKALSFPAHIENANMDGETVNITCILHLLRRLLCLLSDRSVPDLRRAFHSDNRHSQRGSICGNGFTCRRNFRLMACLLMFVDVSSIATFQYEDLHAIAQPRWRCEVIRNPTTPLAPFHSSVTRQKAIK